MKRVNVVISVLVFAGIGFLILFGVCLCLLRAGSEADDRVCMLQKKDDEKNSENIKKILTLTLCNSLCYDYHRERGDQG